MSQNPPVRLVISDEFYEAVAKRNAGINADRAAKGLPSIPWEPSYISESQARAEDAQREKRASNPANLAPPPSARGRLTRAAKAKVAERNASIPGFERHSRKCQICRSPYVDLIEQVYLQWERVEVICRYFQLADTDTVYRHARAAGLDVLRRQNSRWVIEQFIEQWRSVKISSATVIRSIRALSCLDDKGRWTDLPKTHIFMRRNDLSAASQSVDVQEDGDLPPSTGKPIGATTASDTSIPEAGSDDVSFSFERSEPYCGRDSGLPREIATSSKSSKLPKMGRGMVLAPSTERSESHENPSAHRVPNRRSSSAHKRNAPSDLEPPASSFQNLIEFLWEIRTCRNQLKTKAKSCF